jgi:hypothetical protein
MSASSKRAESLVWTMETVDKEVGAACRFAEVYWYMYTCARVRACISVRVLPCLCARNQVHLIMSTRILISALLFVHLLFRGPILSP